MFFWCVSGYKDIIHIDQDGGEFLADLIHKPLEGLCCILESIRHHEVFIEAKWCYNGSLWDVIFVQRNLAYGLDKVNLGEDCGSA